MLAFNDCRATRGCKSQTPLTQAMQYVCSTIEHFLHPYVRANALGEVKGIHHRIAVVLTPSLAARPTVNGGHDDCRNELNLTLMKQTLLSFFFFCSVIFVPAQGIIISENPGTPDSSAILDVSSTTQGFLPPRMTSAQRDAISSPASGLIIYNTTTRCLQTFISPVWQNIYCGCDPPLAPEQGVHTASDVSVTWNWSAVEDADGYKYGYTDDFDSATDAELNTSFVQNELTCGTAYTLYVWAYAFCGHSESVQLSQSTNSCCTGGDLSAPFGTSGVVTSNMTSGNDATRAVVLTEEGLFVAGYYEVSAGDFAWRVERRDPLTGTLIDGFGTAGVVNNNPSSGDEACWDMVADDSGLFIGGFDRTSSDMKWRIEKRSAATGALIGAFGTGGVVTNNPSASSDQILGMAIDESGVYACGSDNSPGNLQCRIEKRNPGDGSLIWTQTANPSTSNDEIWALALDETAVYAAGYDSSPGNQQWRIEKRNLSTGALVAAFGSSGVVTTNPSSGHDQIRTIAIDETGIYVGGYDLSPGNAQWRIEKRDLTTGALISTFGTGGVITLNPGSGSDGVSKLVVDEDGLYVSGYETTPGNMQWRLEHRDPTTGAVIWTQLNNPSSLDDAPADVATDTGFIYICGRDQTPGNNQWRIEKRCK